MVAGRSTARPASRQKSRPPFAGRWQSECRPAAPRAVAAPSPPAGTSGSRARSSIQRFSRHHLRLVHHFGGISSAVMKRRSAVCGGEESGPCNLSVDSLWANGNDAGVRLQCLKAIFNRKMQKFAGVPSRLTAYSGLRPSLLTTPPAFVSFRIQAPPERPDSGIFRALLASARGRQRHLLPVTRKRPRPAADLLPRYPAAKLACTCISAIRDDVCAEMRAWNETLEPGTDPAIGNPAVGNPAGAESDVAGHARPAGSGGRAHQRPHL